MRRLHLVFLLIIVVLGIGLILSTLEKRIAVHLQERSRVLHARGDRYMQQGRYQEAEQALKAALFIAERYPIKRKRDSLKVAAILTSLSNTYSYEGRYSEALPLYKRALEIREKRLTPDHPLIATALNNLGATYSSLDKFVEAEDLLKRSLAIDTSRPDTCKCAVALNNLGKLYEQQGRVDEAETLYKQAIEKTEESSGTGCRNYPIIMYNLAELYAEQDRCEEAEVLFKRTLEIQKRMLGSKHPSLAPTLAGLAGVYVGVNYTEARHLFSQAIEVLDGADSKDYWSLATYTFRNAHSHLMDGEYEAAHDLFERSLSIRRKVYGENSEEVVRAIKYYAEDLEYLGQIDEANKVLTLLESIQESPLRDDEGGAD